MPPRLFLCVQRCARARLLDSGIHPSSSSQQLMSPDGRSVLSLSIFSPKRTRTTSSLGQTFMEKKARVSSLALTLGVKSEAVENERTCKTLFVQAGSAPSAVRLGEHLCRLPGPVPASHAPWYPCTDADSRHAVLSRSSPSSLPISAARLCFYTL